MRNFLLSFIAISVLFSAGLYAQVTTSGLNGKVVSGDQPVVGATVVAVHEPSGTRYGTITNANGNYSIHGMRVGGPYRVEVSFLGYQKTTYKDITLQLGEMPVLNASLRESTLIMDEIVVTGQTDSNMSTSRAGAVTSVGKEAMALVPTVSRSMNDIMRLSPQSATTSNGFAVGGGNYRQSYVTVDGAAFNNAFGIGQNLPSNGSPISLDALQEITVSVTPFDVRQSGFTGGSINAVTRSGDNTFRGTAYSYFNNESFHGKNVADYELTRLKSQYYTYGASVGGPIVKDKLFFFVNGEYEDNVSAGPQRFARNSAPDDWGRGTIYNRPTVDQMNTIQDYLIGKGYNPGRYQNYSVETPAYRIMARMDWNIDRDNRLNIRFSKTKTKDSSAGSSSVSPFSAGTVYPGNTGGVPTEQGRTTDYAMPFESTRYYQERNFTSIAGELNSRLFDGRLNNLLRVTYSYQDEPRSYEGGFYPTVDILQDGADLTTFGPDPFTYGNLRQVKTFVATDEVYWTSGLHKFTAGLQFEYDKAVNGFMPAGAGYYVYSSWNDFTSGAPAAAFAITHSSRSDLKQVNAEFTYNQYSLYLQDEMSVSDNLKLSAGLRLETPIYPSLDNNYNEEFANLNFGGHKYSTSTMPKTTLNVSPRFGFNWDLTGDRKYVLRGGTGVFTGRIPFVWIVSTIGNSNVGQTQVMITDPTKTPGFATSIPEILDNLYPSGFNPQNPIAPQSPTIMSENLKMPSAWKSSLALDMQFPCLFDFSLEGIYNQDINPVVLTNVGLKPAVATVTVSENDVREKWAGVWAQNSASRNVTPYLIENGGGRAYYYSVTAQLHRKFNFGLDLSAAYTHAEAKSYGDGIGDQVTSAWKTNTYSVNGTNGHEVGYGSYVAPHRVIASIGYRKEYAKTLATSVALLYEGTNLGFQGGSSYSYTRFSYLLSTTNYNNVVGDSGPMNLMYIPSSKDELLFKDYTYKVGDNTLTYTAADQQNDFWNYLEQDAYLSKHKGEYAKRNGAKMPWHHQFDFKFMQDFGVRVGQGKNTLQFGVDIKNVGNLLNKNWGLYKQVNQIAPLKTNGDGTFAFQRMGNGDKLTETFSNYTSFSSTYSIQFSLRYIFN